MAVQSIDRVFQVLKALAVEPSGVTELASRGRSAQVDRGPNAVEPRRPGRGDQRPGRHLHAIGIGLVELAGVIDATAALATVVRPHLVWLSDQLGEAAGFSIPTGYTIQYMVQVESPNPVQVRDYTGLMVPMHIGPGLCVMAQWPAEEVDRYLSRPLEAYTTHTVVDASGIRTGLEAIRGSGHCWIHEEFAEGINSVAAPVLADGERALGAIHVHGPAYRFPAEGRADSIASLVMDAVARFSSRSDAV